MSDNEKQMAAFIEALKPHIQSLVEEQLGGFKKHAEKLLDEVKDGKRTNVETDRFAEIAARHEKQMRDTAILLGTKPVADQPKNTAAVVLTREQARNRQTYQEAEARAKARGVPLRVASDGEVQSWRNNKTPVVQTKTISFDDTHDGIRYVRADMHDGPGNVQRQLKAEKEGLKLRTFRSLDDLPAHARQKFELMEAAANANGES
ncbi:MAG: hypothetical protein ACT4OK_10410 [Gemmobacter sp.]